MMDDNDETNAMGMPQRPVEASNGGTLHPILLELFTTSSSHFSDGMEVRSSPTFCGNDGEPSPASSAPFVSPLWVLNHLLGTAQVPPDAVRRAYDEVWASRLPSTAAAGDAGNSNENNCCAGGAAERSEAGDAKNKRKDDSSESLRMSRRQRKKLQREAKEAAAAAAAATATGKGCAPPDGLSSLNFERHVALRIYYDGENYSGLAENVGRDDDRSIEKSLFAALVKARLVTSRESCHYSRSGRTDRGVSAAGQVIALRIKSAFKTNMRLAGVPRDPTASGTSSGSSSSDGEDPNATRLIREDDLPPNSFDQLRVLCPARNPNNDSSDPEKRIERLVTEYSYDKVLNNLLPPEIRVLGWCPVSSEFSARFSATSRTYRYFFVRRNNLNVDAMRSALHSLVGTHDFRNFCRMDVEKVYNFVRTVYRAEIKSALTDDDNDSRVAWIEIHGQAFLWHQIRCIAAILFLVGEGVESPDVVRELLDVERNPRKPSYQLACDAPLVLHSCDYDNLRMGYSVPNLWNVTTQQEGLYQHALISAARIRNCLSSLEGAQVPVSELLAFAEEKSAVRRKKLSKSTLSPPSAIPVRGEMERLQSPFGEAQSVSWKEALDWMKGAWELAPEPYFASKDSKYIPLLKRHSGPTYEEKVANLQHSTKRKERYVTNVIKKRKTKEEDAEFYRHMARQGSSSIC